MKNARLTALIQGQFRLHRIPQADVEVTAIGEFEIHRWTVIAILVNRGLANHLADEFLTVDHAISRLEWSQKNIPAA